MSSSEISQPVVNLVQIRLDFYNPVGQITTVGGRTALRHLQHLLHQIFGALGRVLLFSHIISTYTSLAKHRRLRGIARQDIGRENKEKSSRCHDPSGLVCAG